ncbi:hypothetical protein IJT93_01840 [bacterium]|nr:hypothetical protein [bacterium]
MNLNCMLSLYHREIPDFIVPFLCLPEMERLKDIGMNCGCEYTSFSLFKDLPPYSRFDHSLGAALIVWNFSHSPAQALAALFHDIATPVFAHCIDFMRGDHLKQEATESYTETIIGGSGETISLLRKLGLSAADVNDYHRYPIADNDSPRLSADRLEYTLGNLLGYGFADLEKLQLYYNAVRVAAAPEDGKPELAFSEAETALSFALNALRCSKVYVSPEDRYAMQMIAELMRTAADRGVLNERDLYRTEPEVIELLEHDSVAAERWRRIRAMHKMISAEKAPASEVRVIRAKKRRIDPLVIGQGRLSDISGQFRTELRQFLDASHDEPLCAV